MRTHLPLAVTCWGWMLPAVLTISLFAAEASAQVPLGPNGSQPNVGPRLGSTAGPSVGPSILLAQNRDGTTNWAFGADTSGLKIQRLALGGIAAKAGFQVGDTILAVNRSWVRSPAELARHLQAAAAVDGRAWVLVDRGSRQEWVHLRLNANVVAANQVFTALLAEDRETDDIRAALLAVRSSVSTAINDLRGAADRLHERANQIADKTAAVARQKAELVRNQVAEMRVDLGDLLESKGDLLKDKLAAWRTNVNDLHAELMDFGSQVDGELRAEIDGMIRIVVRLKSELETIRPRVG